MTPKIALHMPLFNNRSYVGAAIESALSQTRDDFELLIWDDGSTDGSLEIARAYEKRDPRVRVVAGDHRGIAGAPKAAVERTSAPYIGQLDSDDLLAPTALEKTSAVLDHRTEVAVVYSDYQDIDPRGRVVGLGQRCNVDYSPHRMLIDFMMFHFRLIRREAYLAVGGIDDDPAVAYAYDYDLCLKLCERFGVHRLPEPLYFYRQHVTSTSHTRKAMQTEASATAVRRALARRKLDRDFYLEVLPDGRFRLRRCDDSH